MMMTQVAPELPREREDGRARAVALANRTDLETAPTSIVTYVSQGRLLVVGDRAAAMSAAGRLAEMLRCTVFCPGGGSPERDVAGGISIIEGGRPELRGRLGAFSLRILDGEDGEDGPADAGPAGQTEVFDLVLDLTEPKLLGHDIPPPGYYAPEGSPEALEKALTELPEMTGEFEKPKYFNYDPNICAHGNSGLKGCTRCIDACPTIAIVSIGDKVQVDPYLCQGAGSCVAACPSGAMTYAFPTVSDLLRGVQSLLAAYREAEGARPYLLFHDSYARSKVYGKLAGLMPESVLPIEVEEIGAVGMDAWMTCLAYGADAVLMAITGGTPTRVVTELDSQITFATAILEGMGFTGGHIRTLDVSAEVTAEDFADLPTGVVKRAARFVAPNEKRMILRLAIDHIHQNAPSSRRTVDLPAGAPFGEVQVDADACTLCMGCVSVCPTAALAAGGDLPQLKFVEWNCVQCGLCEKACPEDAIKPRARFLYDSEARQRSRILHEEQPFCCISCGKPFATQSLLDVMMKKLEGHWMFQSEEARRRLQMCEHCRVKDMFRSGQAGGG